MELVTAGGKKMQYVTKYCHILLALCELFAVWLQIASVSHTRQMELYCPTVSLGINPLLFKAWGGGRHRVLISMHQLYSCNVLLSLLAAKRELRCEE